MKSNMITKMITMCMCMVVVGFASEGKQHLNEQQLQNPASISIDKDAAYQAEKKIATMKEAAFLENGMQAKRDELKANPTPTGNDTNYRDCENDDSSSDAYGDTCSSWYDTYESPGSYGCSGGYNDDDFDAAAQCCACGGGNESGCADGEFTCDDGACIPGSWECDVYYCDCAGCEDEADCGAPSCEDQGLWDCGDGQCIPSGYVCDGSSEFCNAGWGPDCANGADEGLDACGYADDCAAGCDDTQFDCGDGQCIYDSWECDGWADCSNGADEADCAAPSCEDQGYADCGDGQCIYESWICDGWADCSNGADEADCAPASCADQGLWDCGDGQCIPSGYVCDGSSEFCNAGWGPDCANGADEGLESCGYADECGPGVCEDCAYDFTPYGAECCDAAADAFGLSCAALEGNYGWDCTGCSCPLDEDGWDDLTCAEQGALDDCADDDCCPTSWVGDGYADGSDQPYGCDLTCYECDGGDVASDCAGTCEGTETNDECGVCGGGGIADGACDCDGNVTDECGDCGGGGIADGACDCDGNTSDACGVCGGDSFVDCNGDCAAGYESWVGDTYCDDGAWGLDFTCMDCDGGDCLQNTDPEAACYSCDFADCIGQCAEGYESWVGDGYCDDGAYGLYFDCDAFGCDGGDCDDGCGCGEAGPSGCDNACGSDLANDECGVCDGDNSSCSDCAGVPNGGSTEDNCGTCDDDASNDCTMDCAGNYGGSAEEDFCGVCDGDNICEVPACDEGYVADCADDDCCPASWIGDGFADCEEQAYGCDLTCYDEDGGDCADSGDSGGSEACSDCAYDFTPYGSECCDTAAAEFGLSCAALEGNYNWDCSGCECPLDGDEPEGCADGMWDCGDGQCIPASYVCDGSSEFCNAGWGADCANGADEGLESCGYTDDCAAGCADGEFTCNDGSCIPGSWECDVSWCDCPGDACEDEADCGGGDDGGGGECVNDDSSSDAYGDTCSSWYDAYESEGSYGCSGGYNDDDFDAAAQCCACGGGDTGGRDAANTSDDEPLSQEHVAYKLQEAMSAKKYAATPDVNMVAVHTRAKEAVIVNNADPVALEAFERKLNEYDAANASRDGEACDGTWSGSNFGCDGVCDSGLSTDECGDCGGGGIADGACDCDGNTSDACGVCGGDSFVDCNGDCAAGYESWVGDTYCDDGAWGLDFTCMECDGGDCLQNTDPDAGCYSCDFADCTGLCAEGYESWVGDGYCDDGAYGLYFDCDEFDCDGGDCDDGCGCGEPGPSGCDNACGSDAENDECGVCGGDNSSCADCAGVPNGDSVDDCDGSGECWGGSWVGDGYCDGADQAWGADLTCYDCDGGDCEGACGCDDNDSCNDCCGEPNGDNSSCGGSGDVNGGGVDVTDIVAMVSDILQTEALDECGANEADITGDGTVNVLDVIAAVEIILSGSGDDGGDDGGSACDEGYVADCVDDDCCPASWVGDGFEDCEDQAYGCDLTCYDNDGGDCDEAADDGGDTGGSETCSDCEFDFTPYGSECCDTAWDEYGLNCAALEGDYNWDCSGCGCPGDVAGECGDGACNVNEDCETCEADCGVCGECGEGQVADCVDNDCCPESWIGDGFTDCEDQQYGCDLTCYDNDGGDCDEAADDGGDTGGSDTCSDCEYDWSAYGSECCDTAATEFGISCADLAGNYGWDCSGCNCPLDEGDPPSCADQGLWDCGDGQCIPASYVCDGSSEFCNAGWGPDCANGADEGLDACGYTDDCAAGCADGEFTCDDGACIPGSWECDVYYCDCAGCEDEADCDAGGDDGGGGECVNDDSSSDAYGDTCSSWYDAYESEGSYGCSGGYNDDDFDAAAQCCACGGGDTGGRDAANTSDDEPLSQEHVAYKLQEAMSAKKYSTTPDVNMVAVHTRAKEAVIENNADPVALEAKVVHSSRFLVKSIAKDVGKNPADVIKNGASLNRKATGFESKLQRANSVKLIQTAEGLKYEADGFVGFEITLSHGADFEINVTESAFIADYNTVGNTTKVIVVNPETADLFTSTGDYEIVDVIAGTSGGAALTTKIVSIPTVFGLNDAYPNPFNPTTSVELALPHDGFVSVKVYNLMGQVVATLHEGDLTANSYSFTWDAADVASGMYLLQAETVGKVDVQKIMLMK